MGRGKLKTGFSTGTAAAAAAAAALEALMTGDRPARVTIELPIGGQLSVPVRDVRVLSDREALATVVKDAGDDPDATHGAAISARIERLQTTGGEIIEIDGGEGVGRVTRPGLPLPVGQAAINPVPRQMIADELRRAWERSSVKPGPCRVRVVISVADGERIARKTLNPRLGIVGGISILGTTGIVKPFSHEAYTATIESAMSVARAGGLDEIILTTGGRSEKHAIKMRPDLPEPAFIQIADFFGFALIEAKQRKFKTVGLVSFFGKAVKQAQGLVYTHAHKAPMDLARLAGWLGEAGAGAPLAEAVASANTARHALDVLKENESVGLTAEVGRRMLNSARGFLGSKTRLWAVILDYNGHILYQEPKP